MTKPNLDRMRKYSAAKPAVAGSPGAVVATAEDQYPPGTTVIRDAVGQVIRVIEPNRG